MFLEAWEAPPPSRIPKTLEPKRMTPFQSAVNDLKLQWREVAGYAVAVVAAQSLFRAADLAIHGGEGAWVSVVRFLALCMLAAAVSSLQAVFFTKLGKRIDYPVWRCGDAGEALRRFFSLWLILNLVVLATVSFHLRAMISGASDLAVTLEFLIMAMAALYIPLGACLMRRDVSASGDAASAFLPLLRQLRLVFPVMLLGIAQLFLLRVLQFAVPMDTVRGLLLVTAADAPLAALDCLMFAMMWRVLMHDREASAAAEGSPFDF